MRALALAQEPGSFAIVMLPPDADVPGWAWGPSFSSVTRTGEELSIVCREQSVPAGIASEAGWCCLRVVGPLEFTVVGVVASLTEPLARAGVPVFVISTFATDYLLVRAGDLPAALDVLRLAGHAVPADPGFN